MRTKLMALATMLLIPILAFADDTGFYIGVGGGNISIKDPGISSTERDFLSTPYATTSRSLNNSTNFGDITVGYDFNRYIGVEALYMQTGTVSITDKAAVSSGSGTITGTGFSPVNYSYSGVQTSLVRRASASAYGGSFVFKLPLNDRFSVHAKAGYMNYNVKEEYILGLGSINGLGNVSLYQEDDSSASTPFGSVGFGINLWKSVSFVADYTNINKVKAVWGTINTRL